MGEALLQGDDASAFSSSLDPQETKSPKPESDKLTDYWVPRPEFSTEPITDPENAFRHGHWKMRRRKVWDSLKRTGANGQVLDRFANCGSGARVEWSPSEKRYRIRAHYCHHRLCLACGEARSRKIASALTKHLRSHPARFVTLTLRHSAAKLTDQLNRLYRSFAVLRRRNFWKDRVSGGAAFLEIKYKPETRTWHPHLHILAQTDWLPQKDLSAEWLAVTGDSYIVDVRPIADAAACTAYVCKYASKPLDPSLYCIPDILDEAACSLRGRRLCLTFAGWRGLKLEQPSPDPDDWVLIGRLDELWDRAERGDIEAARILAEILHNPTEEHGPP